METTEHSSLNLFHWVINVYEEEKELNSSTFWEKLFEIVEQKEIQFVFIRLKELVGGKEDEEVGKIIKKLRMKLNERALNYDAKNSLEMIVLISEGKDSNTRAVIEAINREFE